MDARTDTGRTNDVLEAARGGDVARLRELLRVDPALARARDGNGVGALLNALYHGQAEAAGQLREALPELDLFEAAAVGDERALEARLDAAPDAALQRAGDGFTALHLACFFGRAPAVRLLLARGADVGAVASNPSRVQPLHSAIPGGAAEVVALLLEAGAEVDAPQAGGWTALMAAAKRGSAELVAPLLAAGADPGREADDGRTARDLAAPEVRALLG